MDRVRANREVHDLLRDGYRAEWTDDRGEQRVRHGALRRLPRLDEERLAGGVAGVGRRRPAPPAHRRGAVRQRHPAGAGRVQGAEPAGQGGVRREPHRLPRHDPAAVRPERVRDPARTARRRRSARPTRRGSSSATGRSSTPTAPAASSRWRPPSAAPAPTTGCSTWSRTSSPSSSGPAG